MNLTPLTQDIVDGDGNISQFPIIPLSLTSIDVNVSGGFPITLVAATAGQLVRVYRVFLVVDNATVLSFLDGATLLPRKLKCAAGQVMILDQSNYPWWQGSPDTDFKLDSTNAVQLTGAIDINLNPT